MTGRLRILPCLDSPEVAEERRRQLDLSRERAAELGRSAVEISRRGSYLTPAGDRVDINQDVAAALTNSVSIQPDHTLPSPERGAFQETRVQVTNESTLIAAKRLYDAGHTPIALNFANGVHPGGGFLNGARAQEEVLCRSSALFLTLKGDPMYEAHSKRPSSDSSDWAIYSPAVPVFRNDEGIALERPWKLSFVTCAAPYAPATGQPESRHLLRRRIHRVLDIMQAYKYTTLVLGAWGCGAFGNNPEWTAHDFRDALENKFRGAFSDVVFAITDWSPERRFLGPFNDTFLPD